MEKDITIGFVCILAGAFFIWWSYKYPVKNPEKDALNRTFKGYIIGVMLIMMGITFIVQSIKAGRGLLTF